MEVLKADLKNTLDILVGLLQKIWEEEKVPTEWEESHMVKLPKKRDLVKIGGVFD